MSERLPGTPPNAVSSVTHLLWVGRWVEVVKVADGWRFKTGRDAAEWLLW